MRHRPSNSRPDMLAGCGRLTAAKNIGETAGTERLKPCDVLRSHNGALRQCRLDVEQGSALTKPNREPSTQLCTPPERVQPGPLAPASPAMAGASTSTG